MSKNFHVQQIPCTITGLCSYRVLDPRGHEIKWVNQFLDAQSLRGLSIFSLRIYAYDLLNFARWWFRSRRRQLTRLSERALLQYVRYQLSSPTKPAPQTINHRLTVVRCLYRFHFGCPIPGGRSSVLTPYRTRSPLGYGKRRIAAAGLRLKQPRRVIVPLEPQHVAQFWQSFRTFRDLSIIALMLFDGLRSGEVLSLQLQDTDISQAQLRILGKGHKVRVVPLPDDVITTLQNYLHLERPCTTNSASLFVSLKGKNRGRPMTAAGLRSLFRHHRRRSQVVHANPHRFRHTFGTDMVAAGISLPALMHLMGHTQIETTMIYVQLSPQEVLRQYRLAVAKRTHLAAPIEP